jgi:hypothetical protein
MTITAAIPIMTAMTIALEATTGVEGDSTNPPDRKHGLFGDWQRSRMTRFYFPSSKYTDGKSLTRRSDIYHLCFGFPDTYNFK